MTHRSCVLAALACTLSLGACTGDDELPEGERPVAVLTAPLSVEAGEPVVVDARLSSDADGYIARYTFDWGDGSPIEISADGIATHIYRFGGEAIITLTVLDDRGNKASAEAGVRILGDAPPTPDPTNDAGVADIGLDGDAPDGSAADTGSADAGEGSVPPTPPEPVPEPPTPAPGP